MPVKIYYNDIPYTDPGGDSYLNQLGYYNFNSIEIIKGAASSLYGAGIGGAMLIHSLPVNWYKGISFAYSTGSFSANNINVNVKAGDRVTTKQTLGLVQTDEDEGKTEVHLEIWKGSNKMDPENWIMATR